MAPVLVHAPTESRLTIGVWGRRALQGVTSTAGVVTAIALLPIAGFFVTGTSAQIPAGSGGKAFLYEDLTIAVPRLAAVSVQASVPVQRLLPLRRSKHGP